MRTAWIYIALVVLADGCAGMAGALLPETWLLKRRQAVVGFATGVLLGVAFLDLLPEALAGRNPRGILAVVLASFTAMAALEWGLGHRRSQHGAYSVLPAMLLGSDALHNTADGAAIAAAFLVSSRLGFITAFAVIVHEVPKEVGDYALLRAKGMRRGRAIIALAVVQLTAGIGALATILAASAWSWAGTGVLGVAAGTFFFIGATDLLPELLHGSQGCRVGCQATIGFLAGMAVAAAESLL